ncbi:MAG: alpha/beta fold hydrolase [Pseudomonas sp.]|nr:alpha/beta fold hydrolase [Pseudomonas sp.]
MRKWLALFVCLFVGTAQAQFSLQHDLPLSYMEQAHPDSQQQPLVIFLHGYGSNELDLFSLKDYFPANYTYLSVRAPMTVPGGGYQWFGKGANPGEYDARPADVAKSEKLITDFVAAAAQKYRTTPGKVVLVGFSQGAIMGYDVALHHPDAVGGVAILSGKMLPALRAEVKPGKPLTVPALFIGHGTADNRLPYASATQAQKLLQSVSVTPQFHAYQGLGHSINEAEINDLKAWLESLNG